MPTKNIDLVELIDKFHSEDRCQDYLEDLRWPEGVACPRCKSHKVSRITTRRKFECSERDCRYQFSVLVDSVLQDTKLPLWKWFLATYMMIESKKGVSANQLKRMLGVSYKTAWYLAHRIRAAMAVVNEQKLDDVVEVDETWIGGHMPRHEGKPYDNKTLVLGAIERNGEVRLKVEKRLTRKVVQDFIKAHVAGDAEAVFTDEFAGYDGIAIGPETRHETVNHNEEEWVRGDVHTNTIEGVWSLLKRSVVGTYHQLSAKHLGAYVDEFEWRSNNRDNEYLFRDTVRALVESDNLEYEQLVGAKGA